VRQGLALGDDQYPSRHRVDHLLAIHRSPFSSSTLAAASRVLIFFAFGSFGAVAFLPLAGLAAPKVLVASAFSLLLPFLATSASGRGPLCPGPVWTTCAGNPKLRRV